MASRVRIVVGCTDRKRLPAAPSLLLRNYPEPNALRAPRWIERLASPAGPRLEARNLYKGEHWTVVSSLRAAAIAHGLELELWIASAGYGLVEEHQLLEGYGATFASRSEDSVARAGRGDESEYWWGQLTTGSSRRGAATSIETVAADRPTDPLLVVLSDTYARAVRHDLLASGAVMAQPTDLMLVSAGNSDPQLDHLRVPADARFQRLLGGTRLSLNARVAKWIIERTKEHRWDGSSVRRLLSVDLERQPTLARHGRQPLSDDEVISYIQRELAENPASSQSALLRRLRDGQRACEQARFRRLYASATEMAES